MMASLSQPGQWSEAPRLELWHVGAVVQDIQAAIRDEIMLGAGGHSEIARLGVDTFDALAGAIVHEVLDVAWVRLGVDRGTLELISPVDPDGPGPQAKLLRQRPGPSHHAYWCDDLIGAAKRLLASGAEPVLAVLAGRPGEHRHLSPRAIQDVLPISSTCYLRLPGGGSLVELNPISSRAGMPSLWGEGVLDHIPQPRLDWSQPGPAVRTTG